MRNFRRIVSIAIFSMLLSVQVHPATPGAQNGPPSSQPGQGGLNSADPCTLVPSPQGQANGIEKLCELGGSAGVAKGDFNGDGIADLAVGAPDETRSTLGLCFPNFTCTTVSHAGAGAVNILYGSTGGLVRPSSGASVLEGGPIQNGGHFGRALAAGNFQGSSRSDLAVGAPGAVHNGSTVGSISVFFSSLSSGGGLSVNPSQTFFADQFSGAGTVLGGNVTFTFPANMSMTWGDFNGDGIGDLAVELGIFGSSNGQSAVLVLYGSPGTGFSTSRFTVLAVDDGLSPNNFNPPTGCAPFGFHFCYVSRGHVVLSSADLDGDGKTDLLIGAPNASQILDNGTRAANGFEGVVAIVPGHTGSLSIFNWSVLRPVRDVDEAAGFGLAMAVGDFDADGKKDVAVGAPNNFAVVPDNAGIVRVFPGVQLFGGQGEAAVLSTVITQDTPGIETAEANDLFGAALAANDFNGDGASDLAIGAPGESTGSSTGNGEVNIIFGLAGTGLSPTASTGHPAAQKFIGSNNNEALGSRLSAWNFGFSTEADLAIGAPFRNLIYVDRISGNLTVIAGAGAVPVVYGASQAVSSTGFQGAQVWVQQPPNGSVPVTGPFTTADVARAGNHFGASVY
jgi:hypothetical protein